MPKVRTTMQPLVELNVTDKEANGLAREGLLLDSTATTRDALIADATAQSLARPAPTGVDFDFTDEDDDTDDEDETALDDTETKE